MKPAAKALFAISALLAASLYAANAWLGALNLDEGWYLYAAKSVAAGARPYRDFFFTQAPLLPAVYGALSPLWAPFGVLGGRLLTALLGLAGAALTALLAASAVPARRKAAAALTAFLLTACNVYHSYFTTIPKTYALASLFTVAGFAALGTPASEPGRRGGAAALRAACGGACLAFAAATRLSLGAMLPATGLYLLCRARRCGLAWLWFGAGGLLGLCAAFLPFVPGSAEAFAFANFFHGGRASNGLVFRVGSLSRLVRNYLPAFLLAAHLATHHRQGGRPPGEACALGPAMWLAAFAAAFAVHLLSPFPYEDYQVPLMPLAAAAVSALFWQRCELGARRQRALLACFVAVAAAFAGTSPLNESWFVIRKDRLWVETKKEPDLALLRRVGREIAALVPPGEPLLTQDAYIAVEAGRPVPPGFEMGPFGYFPELSDADATRLRVLNRRLLEEALASTDAPVAAASGYTFSMAAPSMAKTGGERDELLALLSRRYATWKTIPDFGQEHTTLTLLRAKWSPGCPRPPSGGQDGADLW